MVRKVRRPTTRPILPSFRKVSCTKTGVWISAKSKLEVSVTYYLLRCNRVISPPNIPNLMAALEKNNFVKHFLLGNNMISPLGARSIAEFVSDHPNKIET